MGRPVQLTFPANEDINRLASVGLTLADIEHIGIAMLEAAAGAHPLGARAEGGYLRFSRGIAAAGETLVPRRWIREMVSGTELVTSPDGAVSICITAGNDAVGTGVAPKPRYPRGIATRRKIRQNAIQLGIIGIVDPVEVDPESGTLWMLLHYAEGTSLRLELGLPAFIDDDSTTIDWERRINLGTFGFKNDPDADQLFTTGSILPPAPVSPVIQIVPRD